jgi:hypothetical protein
MNDQDRTSLDLLTVLTAMWASDPTLTERAAEWDDPELAARIAAYLAMHTVPRAFRFNA